MFGYLAAQELGVCTTKHETHISKGTRHHCSKNCFLSVKPGSCIVALKQLHEPLH